VLIEEKKTIKLSSPVTHHIINTPLANA